MTMSPSLSPITEDDIAEFLTQNPAFFERHADILAAVQFTSPHSHRAVSLQERQAEMLREKIKGLEHRVMDMVRHGNENVHIANKVHQWTTTMLPIKDPMDLPQAVVDGVRELFDVPQVALRLWGVADAYQTSPYAQGASEDARAFASSLTMPFCGPNMGFEPATWLPKAQSEEGAEGVPAQSVALLPLREGAIDSATPAFGLLVLGSPDAHRFDATMATDFLSRMAELASAALRRLR